MNREVSSFISVTVKCWRLQIHWGVPVLFLTAVKTGKFLQLQDGVRDMLLNAKFPLKYFQNPEQLTC